jgi:hypothetical protein
MLDTILLGAVLITDFFENEETQAARFACTALSFFLGEEFRSPEWDFSRLPFYQLSTAGNAVFNFAFEFTEPDYGSALRFSRVEVAQALVCFQFPINLCRPPF